MTFLSSARLPLLTYDTTPSITRMRDVAHFTVWWAAWQDGHANLLCKSSFKSDPWLYVDDSRIYKTWISLVRDDKATVNMKNDQLAKEQTQQCRAKWQIDRVWWSGFLLRLHSWKARVEAGRSITINELLRSISLSNGKGRTQDETTWEN